MPFYIHTLSSIFNADCRSQLPDGSWPLSVSLPYTGGRFKAAWAVLTGGAYALAWPMPGDLEAAIGMVRARGVLRPVSKAISPDMSTPEGRAKAAENARAYRENLQPFA